MHGRRPSLVQSRMVFLKTPSRLAASVMSISSSVFIVILQLNDVELIYKMLQAGTFVMFDIDDDR